jgi:hypothetical protein
MNHHSELPYAGARKSTIPRDASSLENVGSSR